MCRICFRLIEIDLHARASSLLFSRFLSRLAVVLRAREWPGEIYRRRGKFGGFAYGPSGPTRPLNKLSKICKIKDKVARIEGLASDRKQNHQNKGQGDTHRGDLGKNGENQSG